MVMKNGSGGRRGESGGTGIGHAHARPTRTGNGNGSGRAGAVASQGGRGLGVLIDIPSEKRAMRITNTGAAVGRGNEVTPRIARKTGTSEGGGSVAQNADTVVGTPPGLLRIRDAQHLLPMTTHGTARTELRGRLPYLHRVLRSAAPLPAMSIVRHLLLKTLKTVRRPSSPAKTNSAHDSKRRARRRP